MGRTKLAIKVLTWSDLSVFKVHSMRSKQRALGLNREIFVARFYPGLQLSHDQVLFPLLILGPGARTAHRLTRMAMRSLSSKDWHIKGESIHDPEEEPGRYGKLAENDFAIMAFEGTERPRAVTLTLVSAAEDATLHAAIAERFELPGKHAMIEVSETAMAHLRASTLGAYPHREHPLDAFISGDTIEDVLFGTSAPSGTDTPPRRTELPSSEDWHRRLLAAEDTRQRGEEFFDPGAKYHVPGNTPYTRYFLSHVLQFQFYKAACDMSGWKGPLHRCSFYGNKQVGQRLNAMLEMGASKPWPDALQALTGQREMDASAMLEYFAPLRTWLQEQNKGQKCGW